MAHEGLTAGEAAHRIGVAVTTLRTWDRRYGLGPQDHQTGRHRRYHPEDLQRLVDMQRLTGQGVPPAQAAAWILDRPAPTRPRDGGGHAVAVGPDGPAVRGLTRAAIRLDNLELRRIITGAITAQGVVPAWTTLLAPALARVGDKHATTRQLIDVEHLLSSEISRALAAVAPPQAVARVLLACVDEEQHSLPLEALAAALAERKIAARQLGARVPPAALLAALRRSGPDVVVLWSQTAQTAAAHQVTDVLTGRPRPKQVIAAGPGWDTTDLPAVVERPASLAEAVSLIAGG